MFWKVSRYCGKFRGVLEGFAMFWKVLRCFGRFRGILEGFAVFCVFRGVLCVSRCSGRFRGVLCFCSLGCSGKFDASNVREIAGFALLCILRCFASKDSFCIIAEYSDLYRKFLLEHWRYW